MAAEDETNADTFAPDSADEIETFMHLERSVDGWLETLYRKNDGRFFVWIDSAMDSDHCGAIFGEWKTPEEARQWMLDHSTDEKIQEVFG